MAKKIIKWKTKAKQQPNVEKNERQIEWMKNVF